MNAVVESDAVVVASEELPDGWAVASLRELVHHQKGSKPKVLFKQMLKGAVPYVDIKAFESGEYRQFAKADSSVIVNPGELLVVWDGARSGLIGKAPARGALGSTLMALRPLLVDTNYLAYFLRSCYETVNSNSRGTGIPHVDPEIFWPLSVPLAPLAEQKRIVAKTEVLLARVNATREHLTKAPAILKRFRQAVLAAACSGRLTEGWRATHSNSEPATSVIARLKDEARAIKVRRDVPGSVDLPDELSGIDLPSSWVMVSVAQLLRLQILSDVKDGNHGANHPKKGEFSKEGLPFITAAQVHDLAIDYWGAPKVSGKVLQKLRVGFAQSGDAVLTHKGTVGRAALCTEPCVLTPQTTYYRCNTRYLDPKYLVYFFLSPQFYGQLAQVMSQTTRNFVPISEQYLRFLFIPPISEQQEIVRHVEALFKLADIIEMRVATATMRVGKLNQAVLAKAFRGELVPTEADLARREGRDYETAAQLLLRIKSERDTGATSKPECSPVRSVLGSALRKRKVR